MNNKVIFKGYYGSDKIHAEAFWTSTDSEITKDKKKRLHKFLYDCADDGHTSGFEKSLLHFLVTVDIATHIQMLKHRIGVSQNSESARYKELKDDKFYIPNDWSEWHRTELEDHCERCFEKYHNVLRQLVNDGMDRSRAKESARYFLPYANQIKVDVNFNFLSFAHFMRLRNSPHAQLEIRELSQEMLEAVKSIKGNPFKYSMAAYNMTERTYKNKSDRMGSIMKK